MENERKIKIYGELKAKFKYLALLGYQVQKDNQGLGFKFKCTYYKNGLLTKETANLSYGKTYSYYSINMEENISPVAELKQLKKLEKKFAYALENTDGHLISNPNYDKRLEKCETISSAHMLTENIDNFAENMPHNNIYNDRYVAIIEAITEVNPKLAKELNKKVEAEMEFVKENNIIFNAVESYAKSGVDLSKSNLERYEEEQTF